MQRCEIIAVGTEILLGDILNTNAQYIARKLAELGLDIYFQTVVGDNLLRACDVISKSLARADIIITSGGLGPTDDDITKEAVCKAIGIDLVLNNSILFDLEEHFNKTNKVMPKCNIKQAYLPQDAIIVPNENGTAPGIIIEKGNKTIILLPGPPKELIPMFEKNIYEYLKTKSDLIIKSKTLKIVGIGESSVQELLKNIFDKQSNPTIAPYAKYGEVHLRITAKATNHEIADSMINSIESEIREIIGHNIYGIDYDTLENVIIDLLKKNKLTISVAESCTGGILCGRLTEVPGASEVVIGGIVSYSNESKIRLLKVNESTLIKYGAVSENTAEEMAKGVKSTLNTDIGVSITGIAGPGGGSEAKPVGLVYIGICMGNNTKVYKCNFNGSRSEIRNRSCNRALDLVRRLFLKL